MLRQLPLSRHHVVLPQRPGHPRRGRDRLVRLYLRGQPAKEEAGAAHAPGDAVGQDTHCVHVRGRGLVVVRCIVLSHLTGDLAPAAHLGVLCDALVDGGHTTLLAPPLDPQCRTLDGDRFPPPPSHRREHSRVRLCCACLRGR